MSVAETGLANLSDLVRRADHDRFATAMFADPAARGALLSLYGLNAELAQIRQQVRDPMAGMIRLQWWREVIEGGRVDEARRHPVAGPLQAAIGRCQLQLTLFERLLDARERDFDTVPFATTADWLAYGRDTSGALAELAAQALGDDAPGARAAGTAWALIGLLRSLPFHLAQGWLTLPQERMAAFGLHPDKVLAASAEQGAIAATVLALLDEVDSQLLQARHLGARRRAMAALLPAVMAKVYARQLRALAGNAFDQRSYRPRPMPLRLAWAALRGRI